MRTFALAISASLLSTRKDCNYMGVAVFIVGTVWWALYTYITTTQQCTYVCSQCYHRHKRLSLCKFVQFVSLWPAVCGSYLAVHCSCSVVPLSRLLHSLIICWFRVLISFSTHSRVKTCLIMNLVVTRIVFTKCPRCNFHSATLARVKTNVRQLEYVLNKLVISSVEIYVRLKPSGRSRCIIAALGTLQC